MLYSGFTGKKELKKNGRGYVSLPSPTGTYRIDYSQSMEDNPAPETAINGQRVLETAEIDTMDNEQSKICEG